MFEYENYYKVYNARAAEDYFDDAEKLRRILEGNKPPKGMRETAYRFLRHEAEFLLTLLEFEHKLDADSFVGATSAELEKDQKRLYQEVEEDGYKKSYLNPTYMASLFGDACGPLLCAMAAQLRENIEHAYRHRRFAMHWNHLLFFDVWELLRQGNALEPQEIRGILNAHGKRFQREKAGLWVHGRFGFEDSYRRDLIMSADLTNPSYLYQLGERVSTVELDLSSFMATLDEERIDKMARAYTQGFRKGFFRDGKDIVLKNIVGIRYHMGMERMIRRAVEYFEEDLHFIPFIQEIATTPVNRQYIYDHRFDMAVYFDSEFQTLRYEALEAELECNREIIAGYGGPAVVDSFGEVPFTPESKAQQIVFTSEQSQEYASFNTKLQALLAKYAPPNETSFTIIAFPLPTIGASFEAIFKETVAVNTLDTEQYEKVQQTIIDALDKGRAVYVRGAKGNETDITVQLPVINNPARETNFYNCVADVNIPVGEVFTSPKLEGTNGVLHLEEIYLEDLQYKNLRLVFQDGYIQDYSCSNFESEEDNKRYIEENLLFPHDTLPLGEFAIGTNTTAYKMARKYGIVHLLPILIVEKMGPHFAIGDTCYARSEDIPVYNPLDGKEIVARDNERSRLRKEDPAKAYTHKHTDITLPYESLGQISVLLDGGDAIDIIRGGRFVLRGTDLLNDALREQALEEKKEEQDERSTV